MASILYYASMVDGEVPSRLNSLPEQALATQIKRRTVLKVGASSLLPDLSFLSAIGGGADSVTNAGMEGVGERLIPQFTSPLARAQIEGSFGSAGLEAIGQPLGDSLGRLLHARARIGLYEGLLSRWTKTSDFLDDLHLLRPDPRKPLQTPDLQDDDATDRTINHVVTKVMGDLAADPQTMEGLELSLGKCVTLEVLHHCNAVVCAEVGKVLNRKRMQHMNRGEHFPDMPDERQFWAQSLAHAFASVHRPKPSIGSFTFMARRFCSDGGIKECIGQLSSPESTIHRALGDAITRAVDQQLARIKGAAERQQQLSDYLREERERIQREDETLSNEKIIQEPDDRQAPQQIIESLQLPFARLMAQIHLLGDPKYKRPWEISRASDPQNPPGLQTEY